ncbi:transmembrane [Fagus crenata]
MLCYRSLPFYILATFLFFFSATLFSLSHGDDPHFPSLQTLPTSGWENEGNYSVEQEQEQSLNTWRSLVVEGPTPSGVPVENYSTFVLASKRTLRKDPLNGFKKYTKGWNLSDRHYWASVGFTAVPLFVIALVWFLAFGLCLCFICVCHFCCGREPYGYSKMAYALSLIFLIIFTITAVIGCVFLYTGQGRFHSSTMNTLEYVVDQADSTVEKLRNVSEYLGAAKQVGVDQVFLPSNVQTDIDQIETKINSSASTLADRTVENSDDIRDLLDSMRLALIIIAAIMLLLTFLGLLFSIFGMQSLVYILVIAGWILVTGTFILCGTFLLLHNVAADTCVAMDEWVQNPTSYTALDDILPCVDKTTAQETLLRSKEVTAQFVDLINSVITNVTNINFSPNFKQMYFNQSGPLVPILCNPFFPDLTDRTCTAGEVDLNNATEVWSTYVCQASAAGICITTGRLTPTVYNQMMAGVNVGVALNNYGPFLVELEDCTFVRDTFSEIYRDHCPGLQQYSRWIYVGLVMVSISVMLSLVFWVIYGRERRHRVFTKQVNKSIEGVEGGKDS